MVVLAHETDETFLSDTGLETDLIFNRGLDLPQFAAFVLLDDPDGQQALEAYFRDHVRVAGEAGRRIVLETPTWRANPDWMERLGYGPKDLDEVNVRAVEFLRRVRDEVGVPGVVISGCVGPRGDGYVVQDRMTESESETYHAPQVAALGRAGVDVVTALTMTYVQEAVGIARAATVAGLPCVLSFTVEVDGRLPDGSSLGEAVQAVDAATGSSPAYFMVNCAHPEHVAQALEPGAPWMSRLRGIKANASRMSHEQLDAMEELDAGDPAEFGELLAELHEQHPHLQVLGGCCGSDSRHLRETARALD